MLIEALNVCFQAPQNSVKAVEQLIRLLHNASLILNDIEVNSPLRRGKAATHLIFGQSQAINSTNFMLVRVVQEARKLSNSQAVDILLQELERLYLGQSWDLFWKHNLISPTEKAYINMVDSKTGGMFRMLLRLMDGESGHVAKCDVERLVQLVVLLGRFFQVRDDYMNLRSGIYAEQKGFCEDLDEGKFSYSGAASSCHQHIQAAAERWRGASNLARDEGSQAVSVRSPRIGGDLRGCARADVSDGVGDKDGD
jgi:ophiobolin F synthase